jgi:hypothetical protein
VPLLILIAALVAWLIIKGRAAGNGSSAPTGAMPPSQFGPSPADQLTQAWAAFEGWNTPGTPAQRYNNPVNIHGSWDGVVGHSPSGIAIFNDPDSGWQAAVTWEQQQAAQHPQWTLQNFFAKVLGSLSGTPVNNDQGNSDAEAQFVAAQIGVSPTTSLSQYLGGNQ